jgi:hypothetical protein
VRCCAVLCCAMRCGAVRCREKAILMFIFAPVDKFVIQTLFLLKPINEKK